MKTNIDLDAELVREAMRLGRFDSKKATVAAALKHYVRYHKRLQVIDQFGTFRSWEDDEIEAVPPRRRKLEP